MLGAISWFLAPNLLGQPWHSTNAIPLFRGTPAQAQALERHGRSHICLAQLWALGHAAHTYATDHNGRLPSTWSEFTSGVADASVFFCPADLWHPTQTNWSQLDLAAISYDLLAPGVVPGAASEPYLRCQVHGNIATTHGRIIEAKPYDRRGFPAASLNLPQPARHTYQESAASDVCEANLRELGLAASLFALDNADCLPSSFADIAGALDSLQVLVCPSDFLRTAAAGPGELQASNITYRIDAPGLSADVTPPQRFSTCPIHDHHLETDGSVVTGTNRYPPRLIVGHPLSWTVAPGQPVELSVLTGDPSLGPFRYQWRRLQVFDALGGPLTDTQAVPDATNRTFLVSADRAADEVFYDVIVSEAQGGCQVSHLACVRVEPLTNVNSAFAWQTLACFNNLTQIGQAARLFASAHPAPILPDPSDLTAYLGWPLVLYCPSDTNRSAPDAWEAVDFGHLSYVFEANVPAAPGTNVLASCPLHGFRVQADGTVQTGELPPTLLSQPASQTTFAGRPVTLAASAIGSAQFWQWFRDDAPMPGGTNSTLALPGAVVTNTASYFAVVSNLWGSATSQVATLTVNPIPPPRLEGPLNPTGSVLVFKLAGPAGVECRLEGSPDLEFWTPLTTAVLTDGTSSLLRRRDLGAATQFYRVVFR